MLIHPLDNTYCDSIVDLILPIQQMEFNIPVTLAQQSDLLDVESFYIAPGGNFWGAFSEGQLVGTIALIAIGHRAGAIRKMFVRKEFRGKGSGIAQRLFETLVEYCGEHGISELYLGTVSVLQAAHRFYERNGFHRLEKKELPGYFPLMPADDIFYHLHLVNQQ
ncbi:GNAT family N-acetyltransferase [Flavitalea sp. BT771]|uniref:GNAT family N-acetyltransferase n=1 Tax=Flavitalea sp. BT771 TaxID=3063329 RepID=UPI0026E242C9|nr:GNAT family N-acetyltransferase [Flavitalea sp. BT771]MDO6432539.1 GNAT family N-acetyltransferase [Flavitalea sp. BT771]MDV6221448.1 GNAT family N-acetyltransferase [Flavitalea sp. BT771]